jgi:hypothetical protein
MARTKTKWVNFETLKMRGQGSVTILKLMMACNDLNITNQALSDWKKEERPERKSKQSGACSYFIRAQIAHLHEGLKIIEQIERDNTLSMLVSQCDPKTQQSFQELRQYVPGGAKRKRFERLAGRIRHNLTFHYDESGSLIEAAIADRAGREAGRLSSITRGHTAHVWHFKVADDVVDSIVMRQIWEIPRSADLRAEADAIADEVHQIFLWFVDFSGEFLWKYCES